MSAIANHAVEIEERRERVSRLYIEGFTQREVAAQLGVSQSTVRDDLAAVRVMWQEDAKRNHGERVAEELARLQRVEAEAWEGWRRSKLTKEETYAEKTVAEGVERTKTSKRLVGSSGSDGFLAIIMDCRKERAKIFGLYAAQKMDLGGGLTSLVGTFDLKTLSDEELEHLAAIQAKLAAGAAALTGRPS